MPPHDFPVTALALGAYRANWLYQRGCTKAPRTPPKKKQHFKAQARVILGRIRYCYRGNRAADARRHLQQARWRSRAEHARSHGRPRGRYSLLHRRP